jgi:predicted DNA-binding transcriptional regulator YafY
LKLDRLLAITMMLLNHTRVSAQELAERFEVSLRTIYRDLEAVNQAGIPIVSYAGAGGGYEIMDQFKLDRQFVSLEELYAIIAALKGIRTSVQDKDIDGLLEKVGALVGKSNPQGEPDTTQALMIDLNPWPSDRVEQGPFAELRDAIRKTRVIHFSYTDGNSTETQRVVEPIGLVLKGFAWYLHGYCRMREDYRIFRLSRIAELQVTCETFRRRPQALEELQGKWGSSTPTQRIELVLLFSPEVKARVLDSFEAEQVSTQADGSLVVRTQMSEGTWLYGMLLSYGTALKVLEPTYIGAILKEKAMAIASMYDKP